MRTRFHSPAFFRNPNAAIFSSYYLSLPLTPPPAHPPTFSLTDELLRYLNEGEDLLTDLTVPALPIQSALSRFYSDVLPHFVDHPQTNAIMDQTSMASQDWVMNNLQAFEAGSKAEQKTCLEFECDNLKPKLEVLQLELPELDTLTAHASIFKELLDASEDETNIQLVYEQFEESHSAGHDDHIHNVSHQCLFTHFKLNDDTSSVCEKLMKDLDHHPSEVEFSLYDKDMSILSMVSEDIESSSANEECKVSLSLLSGSLRSPLRTVPKVDVVKRLPRIPQFDDLAFFLNPLEVISGTKRISRVKEHDSSVSGHTENSNDVNLLETFPVKPKDYWDLRIHHLRMSDSIATLISQFEKFYFAVLESITGTLSPHVDTSKLLRFTKQELMIEFGSRIVLSSGSSGDKILALLTACAIKQMSWYLFFYGIHATKSYINKLCNVAEFLRLRLCFFQPLISDALIQTEEDITRSHPSLAKISKILSSKQSDSESKILIVVEEVLWCPLKLLLSSIGLSVKEIQNCQRPSHKEDPSCSSTYSTAVADILLDADCLIVSPKSVSREFPLHKFALILEYGGSHVSSGLRRVPQTSVGLPPLNFIKMEDMPKVFFQNSERPFSLGDVLEEQVTSLLQTHGSISLQKLMQALNHVPDSVETTVSPYMANIPNYTTLMQSYHCPFVTRSSQGLSSCQEQIVVMNTLNLNKEMIVSRQSTYQRILLLEKEQVQVVERDSTLPADIIITASTCFVWYESKNLFSIVDQTEASSCLSSWIDHIATDVLKQLSFAFTSCYLVFEGSRSFTSSISEHADKFYVAAAGLGMYIQLFYSHSPEVTGEIILDCIRFARKITKNLYPPMCESETNAECFLASFPSINPLSAHAIICSGYSLIDIFRMSPKDRLQLLTKYHVPEVSINLFNVLCKFGEREDTRSGTTDCSSSVASASESEYFCCKVGRGGTKQKFSDIPSKDGVVINKSLQYEQSNLSTDAADIFLSPISAYFKRGRSCLDNRWFASHGGGRSISGDGLFADKFKSAYTGDAFIQKADFDGAVYLDNNFIPHEKARMNSHLHGKKNALEPKNPGLAKRLSFDAVSDPTFSKIDFDKYGFTDVGSHGKTSRAGHDDWYEKLEPKAKRFQPPTYQEADKSPYCGTPLRNKLRQGSPSIIKLLNKVKERSSARQKSLSCETFPPNLGHQGTTKRKTSASRTPVDKRARKVYQSSMTDFYRFQEGGSTQKTKTQLQ